MTDDVFSVYFYPKPSISDQYECEAKHVPLRTALYKFKFLTSNVAALCGITHRVIITDSGDCIVAEWIHGKGVVWPRKTELSIAKLKREKKQ